MAEQEPNLVKFAACQMAQTGARSPQIVRRQLVDAGASCRHADDPSSNEVLRAVLECPIADLATRLITPYSGDMTPLRARVQIGRLRLDEPTALPDGTELDLVIDDEGDDLTEQERQALHETLARSWMSAQEGKVRPAAAIIDELRRKE